MNELKRNRAEEYKNRPQLSKRDDEIINDAVDEVIKEHFEPHKEAIATAVVTAVDAFFRIIPKGIFIAGAKKVMRKIQDKDPGTAHRFIQELDIPWEDITEEEWAELPFPIPQNILDFHRSIINGMKEESNFLIEAID